jgi:hypothetical protein
LWPGEGSISFRSFIHQEQKQKRHPGDVQDESKVLIINGNEEQTERSSLQKYLVIAFDGTWPNARKTQRDIELSALTLSSYSVDRCFIDNSIVSNFALFSPLRRQPTIDRVSTLEAVACCFDEIGLAIRNKTLDCYRNKCLLTGIIDDDDAMVSSKLADVVINERESKKYKEADKAGNGTVDEIEHDVKPALVNGELIFKQQMVSIDDSSNKPLQQHPHEEILPACASYVSRTLRYNLLVLVDSLLREKGMISPNPHARGTGYRTWKLPSSEIGQQLGSLPAHLLERIATFAYGKIAVYPSGFVSRGPKRTIETHWQASVRRDAEGHDDDDDDDDNVDDDKKDEKNQTKDKDKDVDKNDDRKSIAPKMLITKAPELNRRLCQGGLPSICAPYNTTPLAKTNSHLFVLFSGYVKFEDMRRKKRLDKESLTLTEL